MIIRKILDESRRLKKKLGTYYWDMHSKIEFLRSCPTGSRVLDVGCGNNSPKIFKALRPDFYYIGIDVADYKQDTDPNSIADEYIISSVEDFNIHIESMAASFDAVVSSHNIEHCDDPDRTLAAMLAAVRPGGRIFLAFPCEASTRFPRRKGTLNFFDDPTHKRVPNYDAICAAIAAHGFSIDVAHKRYRPLVRAIKGLMAEPRGMLCGTRIPETWALYGFETIIWASRPT